MKKSIWKYVIELKEWPNPIFDIPKGGIVLTAQLQHEKICIWVEVDPNADHEERMFEIFGTGHPIREDMGVERKYISTVQDNFGKLIWHVYERIN